MTGRPYVSPPRILATVVAIAASASLAGQAPVFRTGIDAVRVDVLVTDGRGAPVTGLGPHDFEIRDNNVPQRIVTTAFEELPLHVVLTLDTSGSVAGERFQRLVGAARAVLDELRPEDAATLVAFSHVIRLDTLDAGLAEDPAALTARLGTGGYTSAFDATWMALMSAERPGSRPLVILLSDGFDNRSWLRPDEVLRTARRENAVVYVVRVPAASRPADPFAGPWARSPERRNPAGTADFLPRLAEATGGRVLSADRDRDPAPALRQVLDEFRRRYVLSYVPEGTAPGGWHTIEVRLKARGGKVTARRGYQREPSPASPDVMR